MKMDNMKMDEKRMIDMTEQEMTAISEGKAMAIPVAKPIMSGLVYSAIAALLVAAMISVFIVPVTTPMVIVSLLTAFVFLTGLKMNSNYIATLITECRVLSGMLRLVAQTLDKYKDKNGTNSKDDGLTDSKQDDKHDKAS